MVLYAAKYLTNQLIEHVSVHDEVLLFIWNAFRSKQRFPKVFAEI